MKQYKGQQDILILHRALFNEIKCFNRIHVMLFDVRTYV